MGQTVGTYSPLTITIVLPDGQHDPDPVSTVCPGARLPAGASHPRGTAGVGNLSQGAEARPILRQSGRVYDMMRLHILANFFEI